MGSWYQFLSILAVEVATLLIILLYLRSRGASLRTLGLKNFQAFDILRSLAGFAGYFTLYFMVITVAKAVLPALNLEQQQELGFDTALRGVELIPVFLSLVILPPFVEEILCRGFLYGGLRTKLKPVGAALITSGLFAAAHLQWGSNTPLLWVAAIDTFVLSLVLCYLREKSGRLWASIGLHVIKNLVAFLALFVFKLA